MPFSRTPCLSPASFRSPDQLISSGWLEHIPFAFWLVDQMRPRVFVELGTHTGASYLAFCEGVEAFDVDCKCHAVDTWQGDAHAGFYSDTVYEELRGYHEPRYGKFSTLHRTTFDEALALFPDRSIDLLHIDGLHTYEAVKHDHETWLPKLSDDAVVLFHDTNVNRDDFGVFRYWAELAAKLPSFEFLHGNGLGVLASGARVHERLAELFDAGRNGQLTDAVREAYRSLGHNLVQSRELAELRAGSSQLTSEIEALNTKLNSYIGLAHELQAAAESSDKRVEASAALNSVAAATADVLVKEFSELKQFMDFAHANPNFFSQEELRKAAKRISQNGIYCNVFKESVRPHAVTIHDENYRETIMHKGLNSRLRAIHYVFEAATTMMPADDIKLFAPEAVTAYAKFHRATNMKFVGAEYTTDPHVKNWLYPIPIEDLHNLSFPNGSFRAAIVNEIFEHVPFLDKALSELARILMPGGKLISTFPFYGTSQESVVKATMKNGQIEYLTEPEYHGNPVDPKGSLVFEIPGWEILSRARAAGFRTATMQWVYSESCGILAPAYGGIFVLLAEK